MVSSNVSQKGVAVLQDGALLLLLFVRLLLVLLVGKNRLDGLFEDVGQPFLREGRALEELGSADLLGQALALHTSPTNERTNE